MSIFLVNFVNNFLSNLSINCGQFFSCPSDKSSETNSSNIDETASHQTRPSTETGLATSRPTIVQINRRTKWTKEERINVMRAHYIAKKSPSEGIVKDTYSKWREIVGNYNNFLEEHMV